MLANPAPATSGATATGPNWRPVASVRFVQRQPPRRRLNRLIDCRTGAVRAKMVLYSRYLIMRNKSISRDDYVDLSGLSAVEREEFELISNPAIVRGFGEFGAGHLDDRWIELYLKAEKARLGIR